MVMEELSPAGSDVDRSARSEEISGWTLVPAVLSILAIMFAVFGIYVLLTDEIGIVASAVWFFGLPWAILFSVTAVLCLARACRIEQLRGHEMSRTVVVSSWSSLVLVAVVLGMGLTYFW